MFRLLILSLSAFMLSGCDTLFKRKEPEKEIIYKTKTVLLAVPETLLVNCKKIPPPNKEVYKLATPRDKENMLVDLNIALYFEIDACNDNISAIKDWTDRQKKLIKPEE